MLACFISERAKRTVVAGVAETANAVDTDTIGGLIAAAIVDDPANVNAIVNAFLGTPIVETASASVIVDADTYPFGLIVETVSAAATVDAFATFGVACNETVTAVDITNAYVPLTAVAVASAKNTADSASSNFDNVQLTFAAEDFDTNTFHDTSTNTGRLTIPSSLNGRYGIIFGSFYFANTSGAGTNCALAVLKNGSESYDGMGAVAWYNGPWTVGFMNVWTQPILLSTGDYFEVNLRIDDTATVQKASCGAFSVLVVA